MLKNKTAKAKEWMKNHKEDIVAYGAFSAVIAVYVGLVAVAVKQTNKEIQAYNDQQAELKSTIEAAASRGATVLPGPDGEYWIIENNR